MWLEMQESGVIDKAALVYGQMDEPPGVRLRVGTGRAHDGRVLQGREEPGRAVVRGQHLPLRPGRFGGVDPPRPHAVGRRLPAHAGRRDGRAAGADHVDPGQVDHVDAGRVRAGRRLHRPGAVHHLHPPRRDDGALSPDRGAGHLPGGRPAGVHLEHPGARDRGRAPLRRGPARCRRCCSVTRSCRTSSPSWGSTSSPRRTGSRSTGPARSSASSSQPFFVAEVFTGIPGIYRADRRDGRVLRGPRQRRPRRASPSRPSSTWAGRESVLEVARDARGGGRLVADGVFGGRSRSRPEQSPTSGVRHRGGCGRHRGGGDLAVLDGHHARSDRRRRRPARRGRRCRTGTCCEPAVHGGLVQVDTSPGAVRGAGGQADGPPPAWALDQRVDRPGSAWPSWPTEIDVLDAAEQAKERAAQQPGGAGMRGVAAAAESSRRTPRSPSVQGALARAEWFGCAVAADSG